MRQKKILFEKVVNDYTAEEGIVDPVWNQSSVLNENTHTTKDGLLPADDEQSSNNTNKQFH